MLVLSRKIGEAITIGDGTRVVVLGVQGGRVRLGVQAPATLPIVRAELLGPARDAGKAVPAPEPARPAGGEPGRRC